MLPCCQNRKRTPTPSIQSPKTPPSHPPSPENSLLVTLSINDNIWYYLRTCADVTKDSAQQYGPNRGDGENDKEDEVEDANDQGAGLQRNTPNTAV